MKIGTITPTLGNRPEFLERSKYYLSRQTRKPDISLVVDYPQKTFPFDLTERYRFGLNELKNKCDLIFFIEDDDYYSPEYIETMEMIFKDCGRPEIFGIGETYFYHPKFSGVWYRKHPSNNSPCAFQMCLRSDVIDKINWSLIGNLFTDHGLWNQLRGVAICSKKPIAVGIKHGNGICGAGGHNRWFYEDQIRKHGIDRSKTEWADFDIGWLKSVIGQDLDWYEKF